jgi:hypothetical protein
LVFPSSLLLVQLEEESKWSLVGELPSQLRSNLHLCTLGGFK